MTVDVPLVPSLKLWKYVLPIRVLDPLRPVSKLWNVVFPMRVECPPTKTGGL